jgi:hypothetical protein
VSAVLTLHVGFSGSSTGMSLQQQAAIRCELTELRQLGPATLHHGMCVGADAQAHAIARDLGYAIVGHPGVRSRGPTNPAERADLLCNVAREELTHFARNRVIVDETSILLATPFDGVVGSIWQASHRGGTWYTIGQAGIRRRPTRVYYRDGSWDETGKWPTSEGRS